MKLGSNKNEFWEVSNKKWHKWCKCFPPSLFNNTYVLPVRTIETKCPNLLFYVRLMICRLLVLNTAWKRDFLQIMIFGYVCSTWIIAELKTRFETWITRNDVNLVCLFHLSYLKTLMAYLCSQRTPNIQIKYFMFDWSIYRLYVLNRVWKIDSLQIMIFVNVCSAWGIVRLITRLETWFTRNDRNGVSLFHLSDLITLMAYLCSQCTPNVQIKYFMFDLSIYRLFVLHRGWNRDSLQISIFVYVSWTWSIVELKACFET
jgi:hypothetical protein